MAEIQPTNQPTLPPLTLYPIHPTKINCFIFDYKSLCDDRIRGCDKRTRTFQLHGRKQKGGNDFAETMVDNCHQQRTDTGHTVSVISLKWQRLTIQWKITVRVIGARIVLENHVAIRCRNGQNYRLMNGYILLQQKKKHKAIIIINNSWDKNNNEIHNNIDIDMDISGVIKYWKNL